MTAQLPLFTEKRLPTFFDTVPDVARSDAALLVAATEKERARQARYVETTDRLAKARR